MGHLQQDSREVSAVGLVTLRKGNCVQETERSEVCDAENEVHDERYREWIEWSPGG